ncbi:hypothetical protein AGMMS50212_17040 [Spirochaetia bacterium]|nr:hypothetical protein AGMMS50212_17040 [Spirochaetia bacterium]
MYGEIPHNACMAGDFLWFVRVIRVVRVKFLAAQYTPPKRTTQPQSDRVVKIERKKSYTTLD